MSTSAKWIGGFLAKINDLHLEVVESFQNADGSRVAPCWLLTGKNNGFAGTAPDQQDIKMTGTAVWAVREDGYDLGEVPSRLANTRCNVSALSNPASRAESATERPGIKRDRAGLCRFLWERWLNGHGRS
jgi:hypothetical protein